MEDKKKYPVCETHLSHLAFPELGVAGKFYQLMSYVDCLRKTLEKNVEGFLKPTSKPGAGSPCQQ
jgi:hypothetical protein